MCCKPHVWEHRNRSHRMVTRDPQTKLHRKFLLKNGFDWHARKMYYCNFFSPCRSFLFPADLQLELEYWAETGEFDEDELHEVCVNWNLPSLLWFILSLSGFVPLCVTYPKYLFWCVQMKVMDNKLFSINPQQGKLEPGECRTVSFTYRHTMAGTDRLPVLLKLARGREILVRPTFYHAYI